MLHCANEAFMNVTLPQCANRALNAPIAIGNHQWAASVDPPSAHHLVAVVEHHGLPGRDG
jgi:hypothetical protein